MDSRVKTFSSPSDFDVQPSITSMLTPDEKALYYEIARGYTGAGAVVEMGPWLGSGTYQICRGLSDSGHEWHLTVIDRFRWSELYERRYPQVGLKDGDEFETLFRKHLAPWQDRITCVTAELTDLPKVFTPPDGIEILFVDAPKSWALLWMILDTFGPKLMPGARLVFQDYLHITSRQLIWLLASVRQLTLTHVVENGTTAAFVSEGPIGDLARQVPAHISRLTAADLLAKHDRAAGMLPEWRSGELAVGVALDLMGMNAGAEATRALDQGARDKPWSEKLIKEINRLAGHSVKSNSRPLIEISGYIATGVGMDKIRSTWADMAEEDKAAAIAAGPDPLAHVELKDGFQLGEALRKPMSGTALAARYAMARPGSEAEASKLLGLFDVTARSGAGVDAADLETLIKGKDVVSLGTQYTLKGIAFVALGARSYSGVVAGFDPAQRTYRGTIAGERVRTKYAVSTLGELVPGVQHVGEASALPPQSADVVLIEISQLAALEPAIADARRLARPGARIWIRWRNPYSGSAHGQPPRRVAQIDKNDPAQQAVLDWRHLRKLDPATPTLAQVRDAISSLISVEKWDDRLEDPQALTRVSPKVRDANPQLSGADLVTVSITAVGGLR
jgi:hypothetical protein